MNLFSARVLSKDYTDQLLAKAESPEESSGGENFENPVVSETSSGEELEGTLNVEGDV